MRISIQKRWFQHRKRGKYPYADLELQIKQILKDSISTDYHIIDDYGDEAPFDKLDIEFAAKKLVKFITSKFRNK